MNVDPLITITLWLPVGLLLKVNQDARARGMSRDEWVRAVVAAQFEQSVEAAS